MNSLITSIDNVTALEEDGPGNLCWYIDASFTIHEEEMKSNNRSMLTMRKVSSINGSGKQKKIDTSSNEGEFSAADERFSHAILTKRFIECKNFNLKLSKFFSRQHLWKENQAF